MPLNVHRLVTPTNEAFADSRARRYTDAFVKYRLLGWKLAVDEAILQDKKNLLGYEAQLQLITNAQKALYDESQMITKLTADLAQGDQDAKNAAIQLTYKTQAGINEFNAAANNRADLSQADQAATNSRAVLSSQTSMRNTDVQEAGRDRRNAANLAGGGSSSSSRNSLNMSQLNGRIQAADPNDAVGAFQSVYALAMELDPEFKQSDAIRRQVASQTLDGLTASYVKKNAVSLDDARIAVIQQLSDVKGDSPEVAGIKTLAMGDIQALASQPTPTAPTTTPNPVATPTSSGVSARLGAPRADVKTQADAKPVDVELTGSDRAALEARRRELSLALQALDMPEVPKTDLIGDAQRRFTRGFGATGSANPSTVMAIPDRMRITENTEATNQAMTWMQALDKAKDRKSVEAALQVFEPFKLVKDMLKKAPDADLKGIADSLRARYKGDPVSLRQALGALKLQVALKKTNQDF